MKLLDTLENKLGRFAIRNLMQYIIGGQILVFLLCMFNMEIVYYLHLDPVLVKQGQIWRVFTFLFIPPSISVYNLLSCVIQWLLYYHIAQRLERQWGTFRFNLYYLLGVICSIAVSLIFNTMGSTMYLNESLYLAFAVTYPNMQLLVMYLIPVKMKWLGLITGAILVYQFIIGGWAVKLMILASMLNFIIFFVGVMGGMAKNAYRRESFYQKAQPHSGPRRVKGGPYSKVVDNVAFHRCCICGKTEKDDPNMQFRYCSQCDGAREYCMDHLH
ncbi:MAG: hypothetical protein IJ315_06100, partial [Firmicutes bacterium]|nr:hypothetical protein [Bacillota bacterium]